MVGQGHRLVAGPGLKCGHELALVNAARLEREQSEQKMTVGGSGHGGAPVDAFWSISVYHGNGYIEPNAENAYAINNLTAKKDEDGSITFGISSPEASVVARGGYQSTVIVASDVFAGKNDADRLF